MTDVLERARKYVSRMDAAVSGSGGHTATFKVAVALIHGFALAWAEAWALLIEYNERCQPKWSLKELEHKLKQAQGGVHKHPRGHLLGDRVDSKGRSERAAAAAESGPVVSVEDGRNWRPYDPAALRGEQRPVKIGAKWLAQRSPVDVAGVSPGGFLEQVLMTGERAIVFVNERSQGQFIFWKCKDMEKRGWYELGEKRGERAKRVGGVDETPKRIVSARCGVWWLCQPVDGLWHPNGGKFSRRSASAVTSWRTLVIESDEDGIEEAWLNLLVQLPLRMMAMYTSGGRSVHALVRVDMASKANWDLLRDWMKPVLTRLGADKGVFSAVRLTRLPGCLRQGREKDGQYERYPEPRIQKLLFLNPLADWAPVLSLPVIRAHTDVSGIQSSPSAAA
jgi:hypothetical protein